MPANLENLENLGKGPDDPKALDEAGAKTLSPGKALAKAFLKVKMSGKKKGEEHRRKQIMTPSSDNAMKMREAEIGKGAELGKSFGKTPDKKQPEKLDRLKGHKPVASKMRNVI